MKKWLCLAFALYRIVVIGQIVSKEAFVNEISRFAVDSGFSKFYLSNEAYPCRFKRFDYDELIKYSLKEMVPLNILNELSEHVYEDSADSYWISGKIDKAICIGADQIRSVLNPAWAVTYDHSLTNRQRERKIKKTIAAWEKRPQEEKLVYFFSRPEFTKDFQYAVIDLDYRCDEHECGRLSTYLLRLDHGKWKTIGIISPGEVG